jgi:hypothetical protein
MPAVWMSELWDTKCLRFSVMNHEGYCGGWCHAQDHPSHILLLELTQSAEPGGDILEKYMPLAVKS